MDLQTFLGRLREVADEAAATVQAEKQASYDEGFAAGKSQAVSQQQAQVELIYSQADMDAKGALLQGQIDALSGQVESLKAGYVQSEIKVAKAVSEERARILAAWRQAQEAETATESAFQAVLNEVKVDEINNNPTGPVAQQEQPVEPTPAPVEEAPAQEEAPAETSEENT